METKRNVLKDRNVTPIDHKNNSIDYLILLYVSICV